VAKVPHFDDDIAYISKLGDNPNTDNGLNSQQLKMVFDAAPLSIQKFINDYIVPALNSEVDATAFLKLTGGTMKGNISMNGNQVTGLSDAVNDGDAVSKAFLLGVLANSVFSISQGGTGGKTAEEARQNLGAAAKQHNHKAADVSEWTADILTALLASGYMVASGYQIVESVEAIPADAPEGSVFLVPVEV
jgi:hypothetical protein